ncbi:MAG: BON domain-containing protein [Thermoleophilaceae bacterium]
MRKLLTAIAGTAIATYFLDPDEGTRRRHTAQDRVMAFFRGQAREAERGARTAGAQAAGMAARAKAAATPDSPPADDHALADRVRTELFRPADSPKGQMNVDAVDGVVSLRGQVERVEEVTEIEAQVRSIPGVRDVENHLHTP